MANTKVTGDLIASSTIATGNIADNAVTSDKISGITTAHITEGSNLYYTDARADARAALIVDSAPATLDTLNELAAALGDDPNFATTTATNIGLKAPLASPSFTGNATFGGTITAGDGTQTINGDADLTLRNIGLGFVGIDLKSNRTSGNLGGLRYYGTASDSIPVAQLLVETDGQLKYYNGTNGAQSRLTINSSGNATFAGNVTAVAGNFSSALNARYFRTAAANTDYNLITRNNTGNALFIQSAQSNTNQPIANFRYGSSSVNQGTPVLQVSKDNSHFVNCDVGIGTNSPDANLEVAGTSPVIRITNTTDPLGNGTVGSFEFFTKDSSTGGARTVSSIICDNQAGSAVPGGELVFKTSLGGSGSPVATEKMRIDSSGNLLLGAGIGNPYLALVSAGGNGGNQRARIFGYADGGTYGGGLQIQTRNDVNVFGTAVTIDHDKNVGIGTTSPDAPLEIAGTAEKTYLHVNGIAGNAGIGSTQGAMAKFYNNGDGHTVKIQNNNSSRTDATVFSVWTQTNSRFLIRNDGNVGIGTTSPDNNLHIASTGTPVINLERVDDLLAAGNVISVLRSTSLTNKIISQISTECDLNYTSKGRLMFYTNDGTNAVERMRITSDGSISLNGGILGLGKASSTPSIGYGMFHYSGIGLGIYSGAGGGTQGIGFWLNNGTAAYEAGRWLSNGYLGIGTTLPGEKTSIYNSTATSTVADVLGVYVAVDTPQANKGSAIRIGRDPDGSYSTKIATVFEQSSPSYLNPAMVFYTMNNSYIKGTEVERFRITSAGYLKSLPTYGITTGNAANMHIDSNGIFYRSTSSLKYKTDVRDYDKGLNEVMQLKPKYYKGNDDGNVQFAGLIAEDVHDLGLNEFVQYAKDGTPDALAYPNMIALLTKAIQELKAEIDELKTQINS